MEVSVACGMRINLLRVVWVYWSLVRRRWNFLLSCNSDIQMGILTFLLLKENEAALKNATFATEIADFEVN